MIDGSSSVALPRLRRYSVGAFVVFVHWHGIPGHAGIPANEFSDKLAGQVRELLKAHSIDSALESVQRSAIQDLYPAPR